jgi:anti-sigma B factor antagonist
MADRPAVAKVVYLLLLVVAATPGRVCVCRTGAQMTDLKYPIEMVNGVPVVAAPAEIDLSNAGWLDAVLREATARGYERFVVDMTGTQFCDSAGVGVLVWAHTRALADGGELRLIRPTSAMVVRKFAITGIDQVIPNFPNLDEALEPAPATAPRPPADTNG